MLGKDEVLINVKRETRLLLIKEKKDLSYDQYFRRMIRMRRLVKRYLDELGLDDKELEV